MTPARALLWEPCLATAPFALTWKLGEHCNVHILHPSYGLFFFLNVSQCSSLTLVGFCIEPLLFCWIVTLLLGESQFESIKSVLFAGKQYLHAGKILAMNTLNFRPLGFMCPDVKHAFQSRGFAYVGMCVCVCTAQRILVLKLISFKYWSNTFTWTVKTQEESWNLETCV